MSSLQQLRETIRNDHLRDDFAMISELTRTLAPDAELRRRAVSRATTLVRKIRTDSRPGLMEVFLAEYGLSTTEGVALMCLAEALLRVPDAETIDALIEDKIAPSAWGEHLGKSSSSLVNASTWALMLTGKVLKDGQGLAAVLTGAIRRLGEPVIRAAVGRAMKELGAQFVLGETIDEALRRGRSRADRGFTFSYDMLGEAALTRRDADAYFSAYAHSIERLRGSCSNDDIRDNPGISIKLSALHPRYETGQRRRVMTELVGRVRELARQARAAGMGLNIDAEEADRLDLSLDVIESVLVDPSLVGWDGFGVVVQAYGKRAAATIDWLHALAETHDRKIMVRLVKGAYWDTEIKRAQVEGLPGFPVFTQKAMTDAAYLCCAGKLLSMTDRVYPQFATHNAHSVATILEMADDRTAFEFQRLHGMGEALHDIVHAEAGTRCRIYAPVGAHRDLLAYLVRRLLENGANSSFVNQIVDDAVSPAEVAADPFDRIIADKTTVAMPADLYQPERVNSRGWDLRDPADIDRLATARAPFETGLWSAGPLLARPVVGGERREVINPARPDDTVGQVTDCAVADIEGALDDARTWTVDTNQRCAVLNRAADLYETHFGELFAMMAREAGKTPLDVVSELREAVDFLRYYGAQAPGLVGPPRGVFACISPWNFPLAIFTGQIAAALAAGNGVLAKPAEATSIVAWRAVQLLHQAGVPAASLQLLPGRGPVVGQALSGDPRVDGLCFTGSTATAQHINRAMARSLAPTAPLIAETGGLNAMIVDSTALPEQAVRDILASAFQSAGQRCSALRVLYLQEDVAGPFLSMLYGAMDELCVGDPWHLATDVGPVIDSRARAGIDAHIAAARAEGRVLHQVPVPETGSFVGPTVLAVSGIGDLDREVFGPVLHVAPFAAAELDAVVDAINATGYGLTFGMHSRIDSRVEQVIGRVRCGNIYVNRNQIGAIVGSQPFGGEGLSGTGPKAGGPRYVPRFMCPVAAAETVDDPRATTVISARTVQQALDRARPDRTALTTRSMPGPTGESNRLSEYGRGVVLCLGPTAAAARAQMRTARENGCAAVGVAPGLPPHEGIDGRLEAAALGDLTGIDAVASHAPADRLRELRRALADRPGKLVALLSDADLTEGCRLERHVCIDTTAAGGNASLLAQTS